MPRSRSTLSRGVPEAQSVCFAEQETKLVAKNRRFVAFTKLCGGFGS